MLNKVYISYFYQVRNMPTTMLPLSTAQFQPKWWKLGFDKRGVLNGIVIKCFQGGMDLCGLCPCDAKDPTSCKFLKAYYNKISQVDSHKLMAELEQGLQKLNNELGTNLTDICLVVYEPPSKLCSERIPLVKYFLDNNIEVEEFQNG